MRKIYLLLFLLANSWVAIGKQTKDLVEVNDSQLWVLTTDTSSVLHYFQDTEWKVRAIQPNRMGLYFERNTNQIFEPSYLVEFEKSTTKHYTSERWFSEVYRQQGVMYVGYGAKWNGTDVGFSGYFHLKRSTPITERDMHRLEEAGFIYLGSNRLSSTWHVVLPRRKEYRGVQEELLTIQALQLCEKVCPDFLYAVKPSCNTTNPKFDDQWGLKNTGQENGTPGIDIKTCDAWGITTGSATVKIAVIDEGVELTHPDLSANLFSNGYDAVTNTTVNQVYGNHGTACAGIITAEDNSIGIVGVAPTSKLIPISIQFGQNVSAVIIQNAINWAWQHGADVISNSYSFTGVSSVPMVEDAIQAALDSGRNQLGSIVVFSSGNANIFGCEFPSNAMPQILCVGAVERCGFRSGRSDIVLNSCDPWPQGSEPGSSYGFPLDLVAPGTSIYTTDRTGTDGYNTNYSLFGGDYHDDFGGTSAACPYVAGVAALLLSVNPNLHHSTVSYLLTSTAQKVNTQNYAYGVHVNYPNGTWNVELGYGLVNAYAAVQAAQASLCVLPPANDNCFQPQFLTSTPNATALTTTGTLHCATVSTSDPIPSCANFSVNQDVYYSFIAVATNQNIQVHPLNNSSLSINPVITVYEGLNCAMLQPLSGGCANSFPEGQDEILALTNLQIGASYLIRVSQTNWVPPIFDDFEIYLNHTPANSTVGDYEYWFDQNYSNKNVGFVSASSNLSDFIFNASTSALAPNQIHTFNFRCKDNQGVWSSTLTHDFYHAGENSISAYEYWFDEDYLAATTVNFSSPQNPLNIIDNLAVGNIAAGIHQLHFRTKNMANAWSSVISHDVYVTGDNELTAYQYWFDDYNTAAIINISNVPYFHLNQALSTASLTPGIHRFYFRTLNASGVWSSTIHQDIYSMGGSNLVAYQYWYDNQFSSAITVNNSTSSPYLSLSGVFSSSNLNNGLHQLHFRALNESGNWSSTLTHDFVIAGSSLVAYEYWFKNDYGNRVTGTLASINDFALNTNPSIAALPYGSNTFHVRFKDDNGFWSSVLTHGFCKGVGDSTLAIRLFIEGFYTTGNQMQAVLFNQGVSNDLSITDSVDIQLREKNFPYNLVASAYTALKTNGWAETSIPSVPNDDYYIAVKHRNGIETWSAAPQFKGDCSLTYDFTTSDSNAYGLNQVQVSPGVWAFYSGDINQDQAIDAFDYVLLDIDLIAGAYGYNSTDLNGDGVVDAFDYILLDANLVNGVGAITP